MAQHKKNSQHSSVIAAMAPSARHGFKRAITCAGLATEDLAIDGECVPAKIKVLQTHLNSTRASVARFLALRSSKKTSVSGRASSPGGDEYLNSRWNTPVRPRRCNFSEDDPAEQNPPQWYQEFARAVYMPGWENEALAEYGLKDALEVEERCPASSMGTILGTMLSNDTWYYMLEVDGRRGREIVMRSDADFKLLAEALLNIEGNTTKCPRPEVLSLRRWLDPQSFFEKRQKHLQEYLDSIASQRTVANTEVATQFTLNRYLTSQQLVFFMQSVQTEDIGDDVYL